MSKAKEAKLSTFGVSFKITGVIDTREHVAFEKPRKVSIHASGCDSITISGNGKLDITFAGSAKSCQEADETVAFWLDRLADLMSRTYNTPASVVGVTSRECTDTQTGRKERGITIYANAFLVPTRGDDRISLLQELALRPQSEECLNLQRMYRQALNERSIAMRYILFYRMLESRFGSQVKIDKWIEQTIKQVQKVPHNRGRTRTIYSHIRNKIHFQSSTILFPHDEVRKHIGKLQRLVRRLVDEACR